MKNRLIIFLSLFILLGCSSQKNTTSYSKKQYNEYVSYYNRLKSLLHLMKAMMIVQFN